MEWLDIWENEPLRRQKIIFMTGDEEAHIGIILSQEKLRKCDFYSFITRLNYACDSTTTLDEKVLYWSELPKKPLNHRGKT